MDALRQGAAEAQRSGWHPEASPEALVAFSIAGAMGAAALLSEDASWALHLASDDYDALADEVLDLVVDRTRTTALEERDDENDKEAGPGASSRRRAS